MEAEEKLKKIRTFVFICLGVATIEMFFGFTIMYSGIMFKETEKESALEMLDIIKESNIDYYEKLVSETDNSYMQEFEKHYTKRGNKSLIFFGLIIIIFSGLSLTPTILIMFAIKEKKEALGEDEESGEEEELGLEEELGIKEELGEDEAPGEDEK